MKNVKIFSRQTGSRFLVFSYICKLKKYVYTGCPKEHDSWWIFLYVFFHNLLSCLISKSIIIKIIWQFYYSKIDRRLRYIGEKDFSTELNCKKSLNLIQYLEDDIPNYSSTIMFRETPCICLVNSQMNTRFLS